MIYIVSGGALNSTHSLTHSLGTLSSKSTRQFKLMHGAFDE